MALLAFAAELALETLPRGPQTDEGFWALGLVAQVAAGEPVEEPEIVLAIADESERGPLFYMDAVPKGPQSKAWEVAVATMSYAAYQQARREGQQPSELVENYGESDSFDSVIDRLLDVPDLDTDTLGAALAYVRANTSGSGSSWGTPVAVSELRRAAGRSPEPRIKSPPRELVRDFAL